MGIPRHIRTQVCVPPKGNLPSPSKNPEHTYTHDQRGHKQGHAKTQHHQEIRCLAAVTQNSPSHLPAFGTCKNARTMQKRLHTYIYSPSLCPRKMPKYPTKPQPSADVPTPLPPAGIRALTVYRFRLLRESKSAHRAPRNKAITACPLQGHCCRDTQYGQ